MVTLRGKCKELDTVRIFQGKDIFNVTDKKKVTEKVILSVWEVEEKFP